MTGLGGVCAVSVCVGWCVGFGVEKAVVQGFGIASRGWCGVDDIEVVDTEG